MCEVATCLRIFSRLALWSGAGVFAEFSLVCVRHVHYLVNKRQCASIVLVYLLNHSVRAELDIHTGSALLERNQLANKKLPVSHLNQAE